MGKKLGAAELQANGFFNKIWPQSSDVVFLGSVLSYLTEKFADLDREAMLVTKQLIRSTLPDPDPAYAPSFPPERNRDLTHSCRSNVREVRFPRDRAGDTRADAFFYLHSDLRGC